VSEDSPALETPSPPPVPTPPPVVPWNRGDTRFVLLSLLLLAASLGVGLPLFSRAFPEASLRLEVTREQSREIAETALRPRGLDPGEAGGRHTSLFAVDDGARVYLERTLGLAESNRRIEAGLPIWGFEHRWFVPERKEEWNARVGTDGRLLAFGHLLEEDAPGGRPSQEEARALAERTLVLLAGGSLGEWRGVSAESHDRPARRDHDFVWERPDTAVGDGILRVEIGVAGGKVALFRQYYEVPERFEDDYRALRSRNESTGRIASLLLAATFLGALGVVLARMKRGRLPIRYGALLGATTFVILLASSANQLSLALHDYDTDSSWAGFLSSMLFQSVLSAASWAGLIFVLALAADDLHVDRFDRHLPLRLLLTRRGLATKHVPRSIALGFGMAGAFLAWQVLFYLAADRLGAWAPAEIPYSDLLNTRFPWIAVLVMGFLPAVSEELWCRQFSIPWLEGLLGRRWPAIVVSAFVWGFAHSTYPNQPFFVRGLEIGLAGIVIGFVYCRFGILPALVWHYTIDAGYTSVLLFRSPNPVFVATAAVAAFGLLLPFVLSFVFAWRRGGFEDEAPLLREAIALRGGTPEEAAAPAGPLPPFYVASPRRLSLAAVALPLLLALAALVPGDRIGRSVRAAVDDGDAIRLASSWLTGRGVDVALFRIAAARSGAPFDAEEAKFLLALGGVDALERGAADRSLFNVRFFRPREREEWRIGVTGDGRITGFIHTIPEDGEGKELSDADGEARIRARAASQGDDLTGWTKVDGKSERRKRRIDHVLILERDLPVAGESDAPPERSARLRRTYVLAGDELIQRVDWLKIPEAWVDARGKETLPIVLRWGLQLLLASFLMGGLILVFVRAAREGRVRWVPLVALAFAAALLHRFDLANEFSRQVVRSYKTWYPWGVFLLSEVSNALFGLVASFGGFVLAFGAFDAEYPGSAEPRRLVAGLRRNLAAAGAGPLLAAGAFAGFRALVERIEFAFPLHLPAFAYPLPGPIDGPLPLLGVFSEALIWAVAFPAVALAVRLARKALRLDGARLLAVIPPVALLGTSWGAIRIDEVLWSFSVNLAALLLALFVAERLLAPNPFAFVLAGAGLRLLLSGIELAGQPALSCRIGGGVALAAAGGLLLLPLLLARGEREGPEAA
jgi:hypothetical protein